MYDNKNSIYLYASVVSRSHKLILECTKNYSETILQQKAFVNINIAWGYFLHIIERTMVL